ncbi:hypothetical protein NM208_g2482 [Fusarium decemcellulare]|uniref:Uncharacterized protein n=1 Tax=Fusarium decemcellulare TaxID=57161 RepID=A0ACC1SSR0_9HYPO|nr:hypothetical protein NM208_g2482 [Fusarium decemcellulare]
MGTDRANGRELRSRAGCNKCRQRRVKCPGQKPTCKPCQTLGFICSYERTLRWQGVKTPAANCAVVFPPTTRRVEKWMFLQALPDNYGDNLVTSLLSEATPEESVSDADTETQASYEYVTTNAIRPFRCISPLRMSPVEANLWSYFHEHIAPSCVLDPHTNPYQDIILRIAASNGNDSSLFQTIMAISSSQLYILGYQRYHSASWYYRHQALRRLRLETCKMEGHMADVSSLAQILATTMALIFLDILSDCSASWVVHSNFARSLIYDYCNNHTTSDTEVEALFRFVGGYIVVHEAYAHTAWRTGVLTTSTAVTTMCDDSTLQTLTGCSTDFIQILVDINSLAIDYSEYWKLSHPTPEMLSSLEQRRLILERQLHVCATGTTEHILGSNRCQDMDLVLETKRLTGLLHLYSRLDHLGPHDPCISNLSLQILGLIEKIPARSNTILWPLFMVATLGIGSECDSERAFILDKLCSLQNERQMRYIKKARRIIVEVWQLRDLNEAELRMDSTLEENATAMIQAADQVKASCHAATTPEEQCLMAVSEKCTKAATKLFDEVQKITKLHKKGHLFAAVHSGVRSLWKRSEMKDLDDSLRRYTETMQTLLINRVCTQAKAGELKQRQDFRNLDQELQAFIMQIHAGHTKMDDLLKAEGVMTRGHITHESTRVVESVNAHITNEVQQHRMKEETSNQRERFLQSLKFGEMNQRKNAITDPEDATFCRIFESFESTVKERTSIHSHYNSDETNYCSYIHNIDLVWQSFVDWLRSDEPLFWIQGKPGSGKSTLIRYIISNKATQTLLDQQNPNTRISSHFFWKIGTPLQNGSKGLYCSLLYQLLGDNQTLISFAIEELSLTAPKESHHDWSVRELERVLFAALKLATRQQPLCIFIDGLDEYVGDDGQEGLVQRIRTITQFERVKICVASRPETRLQDWLGTVPNLKLHDLTKPDMRTWVQTRLSTFEREGQLPSELSTKLVGRLLWKAEGVFLWLRLATQSVIRGIQNKDSEDLLVSRLEQLPDALEDLYADMWKRLNEDEPIYRASAATYLRFIVGPWKTRIHNRDSFSWMNLGRMQHPDLLHIVCARNPEIQKKLLNMSNNESVYDELEVICDRTENNIHTQCAGLIESISLEPSSRVPPEMRKHRAWSMMKRLDFLHRTAHDFLVDTEAGQQILSHSPLSHFEISLSMFKGALCWLRLLSDTFDASYDTMDAASGLNWLLASQDERKNGMKSAMELVSIMQSFHREGILSSRGVRWPQAPFLAQIAGVESVFVQVVENTNDIPATDILQELPWGPILRAQRYVPIKGLRMLISRGANPVAITSYTRSEGPPNFSWYAVRTTALWNLLGSFYSAMWHYDNSPRSAAKRVIAAATVILQACPMPMVERWGIISPLQINANGQATEGTFTILISNNQGWMEHGPIRPVLEVNMAFLLEFLLGSLSLHDSAKLESEIQLIRSRIKNATACVRFIAVDRRAGPTQWFRVINQHPFQGLIPLILATVVGRYEKISSNRASFRRWFGLVISSMKDNNTLQEVELADVTKAPAIEERLGPCRLEDAGFTYSDEMKEISRRRPW